MDAHIWFDIAVFSLMMLGSAFFAGSETALTGASRARMTDLAEKGDVSAALVNRLRLRKDTLIGGLLLGNNFVNIFATAYATSVFLRFFGESGVAIATLSVTFTVLVFGEVLPKTYALMHTDNVALWVARPVHIVVTVFSPVIKMISRIVNALFFLFGVSVDENLSKSAYEEELRGAIALFNAEDENGTDERGAMLRSILDLAELDVESVMVHRKDAQMINIDLPADDIIDYILNSPYTRLPVWKDTPENIIGILHAKQILNALRAGRGQVSKDDIIATMMEPWFIPESTSLFDQLQAFRSRREHFSLVVDEYGALLGIATLEDILEEIVGEIDDEHDVSVPGITPQTDGTYIVDGKLTVRDLNRQMDWRLPDDDYDTIAGLILYESRSIPAVGQIFDFFDFRFTILKKQRNQITELRIMPQDNSVSLQKTGS